MEGKVRVEGRTCGGDYYRSVALPRVLSGVGSGGEKWSGGGGK